MAVRVEPARSQPPALAGWLDVTNPWRIFFPMGVCLAWVGVLHWLLFALGVIDDYRAVFHATVQVQGFMTCIAVGFLFTFVPRRTGTAAPSRAELVFGAAAPLAVTLAAWLEHWAIAQALWICLAGVLAAFVVRRLRVGADRVPGVFLWVPVALLSGIAGAVLVAVAAILDPREQPEIWQLGRGLVLQGFMSALIVGVGGTMIPTLTRGVPAPAATPAPRGERIVQASAALLFLASFPVEVYVAPRPGFALRALVAGAVLIRAARLWRPPTARGLHRWFIWMSAWLLPAGYVVAAAQPALRSAALHVTFIGSFALMALSVSLHVALSHGGRPERLTGRPWQTWSVGLLLLAAAFLRVMAGVDAAHVTSWLGPAAGSFLLGTLAWASLVVSAIRVRPLGS
jgi:uncharacterized protein involved in response to NO